MQPYDQMLYLPAHKSRYLQTVETKNDQQHGFQNILIKNNGKTAKTRNH